MNNNQGVKMNIETYSVLRSAEGEEIVAQIGLNYDRRKIQIAQSNKEYKNSIIDMGGHDTVVNLAGMDILIGEVGSPTLSAGIASEEPRLYYNQTLLTSATNTAIIVKTNDDGFEIHTRKVITVSDPSISIRLNKNDSEILDVEMDTGIFNASEWRLTTIIGDGKKTTIIINKPITTIRRPPEGVTMHCVAEIDIGDITLTTTKQIN